MGKDEDLEMTDDYTLGDLEVIYDEHHFPDWNNFIRYLTETNFHGISKGKIDFIINDAKLLQEKHYPFFDEPMDFFQYSRNSRR